MYVTSLYIKLQQSPQTKYILCLYTSLTEQCLNLPYIILYIIGYHNTADKCKDYDWEIVEWQ